jgi:hypothetical protein
MLVQDLQEVLDQQDLQVLQEHLDHQEYLVLQVQQVLRVLLDLPMQVLDHQVRQDLLDLPMQVLDHLDQAVLQDHLD